MNQREYMPVVVSSRNDQHVFQQNLQHPDLAKIETLAQNLQRCLPAIQQPISDRQCSSRLALTKPTFSGPHGFV
jgi:hypothetical protein